jgi:hypothetical protein
MHDTDKIRWIFLNLGVILTAISIGFLIEFFRSEQMRPRALAQVWCLSLISYFIPILWLRWRSSRRVNGDFMWLLVPILGTVLVQLTVIQIPNEITIWNWSNGSSFISDAITEFPNQMVNLLLFFLFYSAISCLIIGLAQAIGYAFLRLRPGLKNGFMREDSD